MFCNGIVNEVGMCMGIVFISILMLWIECVGGWGMCMGMAFICFSIDSHEICGWNCIDMCNDVYWLVH